MTLSRGARYGALHGNNTVAPNDYRGRMMPKAAKKIDVDVAASIAPKSIAPKKAADGDVLHFLTRTLQAHFLDSEPQDMLAKLQNLKDALDRQEATLAAWPDSPSKERICTALAKARALVAEIVDQFANSAQKQSDVRAIDAI
jgi:translation initiation factor RLI1